MLPTSSSSRFWSFETWRSVTCQWLCPSPDQNIVAAVWCREKVPSGSRICWLTERMSLCAAKPSSSYPESWNGPRPMLTMIVVKRSSFRPESRTTIWKFAGRQHREVGEARFLAVGRLCWRGSRHRDDGRERDHGCYGGDSPLTHHGSLLLSRTMTFDVPMWILVQERLFVSSDSRNRPPVANGVSTVTRSL